MANSGKRQRALSAAKRLATRLEGVRGVDVGYLYQADTRTRRMGIRFHVERKRPTAELRVDQIVPKEILGIPCDVVQAKYEPHDASPRAEWNPIRPGISVGNTTRTKTGTLGAFVRDTLTGDLCLLSNWHVLCGSVDAQAGESISQPGPHHLGSKPPRPVAELVRWSSLAHGYDAAIARLLNPEDVNHEILGAELRLTGVTEPEIGLRIQKAGVASGVTTAVIDGIGSYVMDYTGYGDQVRWMDGLRIVPEAQDTEEISLEGDSGAVWVDDQNRGVALHFAGEDKLGPTSEYALAHSLSRTLELLDAGFVALEE